MCNAYNVKLSVFLLLFLLGSSASVVASDSKPNETRINWHLKQADKLMFINLDSALVHAQLAKKELGESGSVQLQVDVLNHLGDIYKYKGEHALSMNQYLKSKTLIEDALRSRNTDIQLNLLHSDVKSKIGVLYLQRKNYKKSLENLESALGILEKADPKTPKMEVIIRKLKVYNNMAAVFIQQQDYNTALVYFRNALELNKTVKDSTYESTLLNNIGICHLEKRELDLASHYFLKALKIRRETGDLHGQAQTLNNLGKSEVFSRHFEQAVDYFRQSLELSKQTGNSESMLVSLESLSLVHDTLGKYKEALGYYKQFKSLNDKIFNTDSKTAILSLEEQHKRENDKKTYQLKLRQQEADRLKAQVWTFGLIAALSVALFTIFILRSRIKTAKLQQENLDLTRKKLEENLEFKERELTAKALFLLQNNELISRITDSLNKAKYSFSKENQHLVQEIINDLRSGQHNTAWEEFEAHFTKVHTQFYKALQEKFPTLTSNEMKLCAFLRLNMSTKDISSITNQSVNSITVARSRLRKKLGIDGEDVHLINFLMELE